MVAFGLLPQPQYICKAFLYGYECAMPCLSYPSAWIPSPVWTPDNIPCLTPVVPWLSRWEVIKKISGNIFVGRGKQFLTWSSIFGSYSLGHLHAVFIFEVVFIFEIVFIFGVIFIFEVVFIFGIVGVRLYCSVLMSLYPLDCNLKEVNICIRQD